MSHAMDASAERVAFLRAELAALVPAAQALALAERAQCYARAVQHLLGTLGAYEAASLAQLEANRDAVLAAVDAGDVTSVSATDVLAVFTSGVEALNAAAGAKRVGLETELVAADAALEEGTNATGALEEVRWCPEYLLQSRHDVSHSYPQVDDADLESLAPALSRRFAAAQTALAAISEWPVTSNFLAVEPAPTPDALWLMRRESAAVLLGTLATILWLVEVSAHQPCGSPWC